MPASRCSAPLPATRFPGWHVALHRLPPHPRRADPRRQLPLQPGHLLQHVDGARGHRLMAETFDKNMIDKDEYPQTAELEMRCVHMLAEMWHAPIAGKPSAHPPSAQRSLHARRSGPQVALAQRMRASASRTHQRRSAPISSWEPTPRSAGTSSVATGMWNRAKSRSKEPTPSPTRNAPRPPAMRTPSASSAFSAAPSPATMKTWSRSPRLSTAAGDNRPGYSHSRRWRQRRLRRALSATRSALGFSAPSRQVHQHLRPQIRTGLSRCRLDRLARAADLHPDLVFNVDYLGGSMPTLAINFSRPASQIVAQYYNLIRLGSRVIVPFTKPARK